MIHVKTRGLMARRISPTNLVLLTICVLLIAVVLTGCDKSDGGLPRPLAPENRGQPDLVLTVGHVPTEYGHVNEGAPVGFWVELANAGGGATEVIAVSVTLPQLVTFDAAVASNGDFEPLLNVWNIARLEAGQADTLAISALVPEDTVGEVLLFSATVTASVPSDTIRSDNADSLQVPVVNNPPRATDDSYLVLEGAVLTVGGGLGVMANDLDFEGETILTDPVPVAAPNHGTLVLQTNGGFEYWHDGSEAVADSFCYRITDASSESDTAMVRMQVVLVNDAPTIVDLPGFSVDEGGTFAPINLVPLALDNDNDDADLIWQVFGGGEMDVDLSDDFILTVTTPGPDWNGVETLVFRVIDPSGAHTDVNVAFTVVSINDAPVVAVLPSQVVSPGGAFLEIPLDSFVADLDHSDAEITWTYSGSDPLHVEISPSRLLSVTAPHAGWTGSVTMTLRATDPEGDWDQRSCRFEVSAER